MTKPGANAANLVDGVPTTARQLESELGVLFRQARELFRTTAVDVHPELNVTGYRTLTRVVDEGPQRAATLVDYFGTDKGSMSRQLAQLERLGLVRRTKDPADGRAQVVTATAEAMRHTALARERSRVRLRSRLAGWEPERVETLAALLHDLNTALSSE